MASIPASPSPASAEPMLIPQGDYAGKPPLRLQKSVVVVGGDEHCHLHLISSSVSRHHALIIHDQDGVYIRDLGSRTKVVVNGQPHRETLLANEDEIHIGKFSFRFSLASSSVDHATPAPAIKIIVNGKPAASLTTGRTLLIGKGEGCDISLLDDSASSRHAIIFTAKGKRNVRDLDSRKGTLLDGEKIHQHEIHPGSELRIGDAVITLAEIAQPPEVIETPQFEAPAVAVEAEPEPVVESPAHSGDTPPLPLEPEPEPEQTPAASPEPVVQSSDTAEPLKVELETQTSADALESILAGAEIDLSKDAIPPEPAPGAQSPDVPEPLNLELETETSTDAPESVLADAGTDSSKDAIPPEPAPTAQSPDEPEPLNLELETETSTDALESALADAEIDLRKDGTTAKPEPAAQTSDVPESLQQEIEHDPEVAAVEAAFTDTEIELAKDKDPIPLDPEPQTPAEEFATPKMADEPAAKIETPAPANEPAHSEIDLSDITLDLEPEPAEEPAEPAAEVLDLSVATPMPPPIASPTAPMTADEEPIAELASEPAERLPEPGYPVIEVSSPPESPIDVNFDLDLHLEPVEKTEPVESPSIELPESFQPKIELTPTELASDEPLNAPQEETVDETMIQASTTDIAPSASSEESPEKTRKRPARGRKTAPKSETKPPKTPRAKAKRRPPKSAEPAVPSEPVVDSESDAKEDLVGEPELSPSATEEIPVALIPDEPAGIAPAISVQPQIPETPPPSDELPADVQDIPPGAAEDDSALVVVSGEDSDQPLAIPAATDIPEAPLHSDDQSVVDWSIPTSATDEISAPIVSEDQSAQAPALSV